MADTGWISPGTGSEDATIGTQSWDLYSGYDLSGIFAADDSNIEGAYFYSAATTKYIVGSNFGFSIPEGATIDGILVEILQKGNNTVENSIKIVKGGTIQGDENSTEVSLPSTYTYVSYGGSDDLWGLSWSDTDINASTFGVGFAVDGYNYNDDAYVDHIRIKVYYTEGGATSAPFPMFFRP